MGSSPDPCRADAYNLQLISALQPKGLVHETSSQKLLLPMTPKMLEQNNTTYCGTARVLQNLTPMKVLW